MTNQFPTHLVTIGRRYGRPPTSGKFREPAMHAAWRVLYGWKTACGRFIATGDVETGGVCTPLGNERHSRPTCARCRAKYVGT